MAEPEVSMPTISFSDGLALCGVSLTMFLVVLDKAGKLRGPLLFVLLFLAFAMLIPVAVGNGWVLADVAFPVKFFRGSFLCCSIACVYCGVALWISSGDASAIQQSNKASYAADDNNTAIFMESKMVGLPLSVEKGKSLYVIPMNQARFKSNSWGFLDVSGVSQNGQWPPKLVMDKTKGKLNPGVFAIKCTVTNHGPQQIIYLGVPIDVWFGNEGGEKNKHRYTAVVSALDPGKEFEFYLVNDCPKMVSAAWQEDAIVQILGERSRRQIKLRRTYTTPIDQIMMLFGASVRWIGGEPCE